MGKKVTTEEYKETVSRISENNYVLLGEYVCSKTKTTIKHIECGNVFSMTPAKFSFGQRCPKCMRPNHDRTNEHFVKEIHKLVGDEYTPLEKYKGVNKKIQFKHNVCGFEYKVCPHKFINGGRRCPKCSGNIRKTTEVFAEEVKELTDGEYVLVSEYRNNKFPVTIEHLKCGEEWETRPANFISGYRCPNCKRSKGEDSVKSYFEDKYIAHLSQYTFKDCKHKHVLPFDFMVPLDNGDMVLIEYQGEQHYKPVPIFGGEKAFAEQRHRDEIKRNYCIAHNIPLIEIPYTELFNIEEFLEEKLRPYEGLFIMSESQANTEVS